MKKNRFKENSEHAMKLGTHNKEEVQFLENLNRKLRQSVLLYENGEMEVGLIMLCQALDYYEEECPLDFVIYRFLLAGFEALDWMYEYEPSLAIAFADDYMINFIRRLAYTHSHVPNTCVNE